MISEALIGVPVAADRDPRALLMPLLKLRSWCRVRRSATNALFTATDR